MLGVDLDIIDKLDRLEAMLIDLNVDDETGDAMIELRAAVKRSAEVHNQALDQGKASSEKLKLAVAAVQNMVYSLKGAGIG